MTDARVLIISRLSTQNAGNEALSKELIHFVTGGLPAADVRALDRYPRYFEQFGLDALGSDPAMVVQAFDALVTRLMTEFGDADVPLAPIATEDLVRLDGRGAELGGTLRTIKRKLAIRRRLAERGLIERDAPATAIRSCLESDLVIWNPAGEIRPTPTSVDHVVRLLLLIAIARRKGNKTAVINHGLEVGDARMRALFAHVYASLDYVGLRDAKSIDVARGLGVLEEKLVESPDLVFLASRRAGGATAPDVPPGTIALAINGLEAMEGADEWQQLMDGLVALDRPLLFLSNAVNHDRDFAHRLAAMAGRATVIDYQPGYQALRGYYRPCSVLVSSRLHASVLSLAEGVPVVSIEPSVFKLTAIFAQMNYPIETERLQNAGWAGRVLASVRLCLSDRRAELCARGSAIVQEQAARIDAAYAPLLALAPAMPAQAQRAAAR